LTRLGANPLPHHRRQQPHALVHRHRLVAGAGLNVRAKRTAQAESIAGLLQELQTNNPSAPVIAVGDYNAYQFNDGYTDPISVITGNPTADDQIVVDQSPDLVNPNFVNLINNLPANEQYSFIFEGTPQAIDHILVNTVANNLYTRIAIAHNNADFPALPAALFESNATRPERNSDHDMPVAYFSLTPPDTTAPTVTSITATSTIRPLQILRSATRLLSAKR
jgi:predicted extracellular nuclease